MAFIKLQFRPGVDRDQTDYSNEGGWYECDKIRFRSGYPEKIGGWVKYTPAAFYGICRQIYNWSTSYSDDLLAVGTNNKVYIESGGNFSDITPLRATNPVLSTPNTNNCIQTNINSNVVIVNLGTPHAADTGSFVTIAGVVGAVGGVPTTSTNSNHQITVITSTSFSFVVAALATSTVAAGGGVAITISFEIAAGNATLTAGYGWGVGTWGRESWGLGAVAPIYLPQQDWWFDNFDNDIAMNIRNGTAYYWERGAIVDPATALSQRAVTIASLATASAYSAAAVPAKVMQLLVSQVDKHLIAFGAVPFGSTSTADFDPLLIRWSDQDNPFQWTPTATNSAGFLRVSRGSQIIRALPTRQEILVWTNTNLYTLQFLGTTDVYGLQEYADNISIVSPRSCTSASNTTYWMGKDKFYIYTGRVETLPCTLRDYVFNNINLAQSDQVVCGTSEEWNEIWWFYPSATAAYNDSYVIYNYLEKLWYYGSIERSAWFDTALREHPLACNSPNDRSVGYLYSHEDGVDDDTSPMSSFIQSSDFDMADGEKFMLTKRILPDIGFADSTATAPEVTLQLRSRNFPGSALASEPSDSQQVIETSVGQYTNQVFVRARARQMALKISSNALGVQWQLGSPRLDAREDGKR